MGRRFGTLRSRTVAALIAVLALVGVLPGSANASPITGTVTDSGGTPQSQVLVEMLTGSTVVSSATTDGSGSFSMDATAGTYDFRLTPPAGSSLAATTLHGVNVTPGTPIHLILAPLGPVITVSGVAGATRNGVVVPCSCGATGNVNFGPESSGIPSTNAQIKADGSFSAGVVSGATYDVGGSVETDAGSWNFSKTGYVASAAPLDLTFPLSQITVVVQDQSGHPLAGAYVRGTGSATTTNQAGVVTQLTDSGNFSGTTDTSGHATWLVPTGWTFNNQNLASRLYLANGLSIPVTLPTITSDTLLAIVFDSGSGTTQVTKPVVIAAGAQSTERVMNSVMGNTSQSLNVYARQAPPLTVLGDAFCASLTYSTSSDGGAVIASPSGAGAGRDALRDSVAGTYPSPSAGAGRGCVDIARSDAPPRPVGSSGDNSSFEYYGYALDAVTWASTSLNAPPALTQAQLQGIYQCTYTNWSQVGGAPGPIQRVLPPDGSGVLDDFLADDLHVSSVAALPASAPTCPAIERIGEDQTYDLFNGSSLYGPAADATTYPDVILPFSAGAWTYQSAHATNPTIDLRSGARPGELVVAQGTQTVAAAAVTWTGSAWQLDNTTVVGDASHVRNVAGIQFAQHGTTVTGTAGTFQSSDLGKVLDSTDTPNGNTITAVAPDGSSATISPGAMTGGTASAAIGYPIVSEQTVAATTGATSPFPGVHYLYNVIDNTEPSYLVALDLVGFQDASGGAASPLCNGGHFNDILDAGFLPLSARTTPGGNAGVTCTRQQPS
jgi:hypothetical protein